MKSRSLALLLLFSATAVSAADYEMTTYYVALMSRGPKWTAEETTEAKKIQQGHMENIQRMAASGKLVLAGPFTDDGDLRGIFVFQGITRDEAEQLCGNDPAVKAGRLRVEVHPWYSAKGIRVDPPLPDKK